MAEIPPADLNPPLAPTTSGLTQATTFANLTRNMQTNGVISGLSTTTGGYDPGALANTVADASGYTTGTGTSGFVDSTTSLWQMLDQAHMNNRRT